MTTDIASSISLKDLAVLLVEDNFLNGLALQQILQKFGCHVIGPVASVTRGLELVAKEKIDLGVLDINIIGGTVEPIAELLRKSHRRFIFVTGYGSPQNIPAPLKKIPRLRKPVNQRELEAALCRIMDAPADHSEN